LSAAGAGPGGDRRRDPPGHLAGQGRRDLAVGLPDVELSGGVDVLGPTLRDVVAARQSHPFAQGFQALSPLLPDGRAPASCQKVHLQGLQIGAAAQPLAQVVGQADRLREALVESEHLGDGPADLGDLDAVRQPGAIVVIESGGEDLGLAFEPPERRAVDDPVAVPLEIGAVRVRRLGKGPALAHRLRNGIWSQPIRHQRTRAPDPQPT